MNFANALKNTTNYTLTENGALTYNTTGSALYDLFALGSAFRTRSDDDCILLFKKAFEEDEKYALKCLFYIRDAVEGQGERRFFRVCMKWLAQNHPDAVKRNMAYIPEIGGRWDDLYTFVDTPCQDSAFHLMKVQLASDITSNTPSLLAKWMKSLNCSSQQSRDLANRTRRYLGMTAKQYRKTLSMLRKKINVLERLMSANEWDKIEYDKIPSRAGFLYRQAFARHDVERKEAGVRTYEDFAKDTTTKVNARVLYPYECVAEAFNIMNYWYKGSVPAPNDTKRLMTNKYWENLHDYFNGAVFNGIAMVDTSGSMFGYDPSAPINVAISLGLYCAEKAKGPYAGHFLTFSEHPSFVKVEGIDFCDKVKRMVRNDWDMNTNVESAFDLLLKIAVENHCPQKELPENLIIISDMEFDGCCTSVRYGSSMNTLMEKIRNKWNAYNYKMPKLVYWNVQARQNNIPMRDEEGVTFVSGFSPVIYEMIMSGKTAKDLMYNKLDNERYAVIQ